MIYKKKIVVFAGTTEGRLLAERLASSGVEVTACVATEYGEKLMPEQSCLTVHSGRMDAEEMEDFLQQKMPHLVVDATHPYAQVVSENVKTVCEQLHMEYVRLLRPVGVVLPEDARIHVVEDAKAAAELAEKMSGNIFLTTGSKELAVFVETINDFSRLYARVLSTEETMKICQELGFEGRQLICMQGPFSEELNRAMFSHVDAKILVTKESGNIGGFSDKVQAALAQDMQCIVIRRPKEQGLTFEQVCERLGVPGIVSPCERDHHPVENVPVSTTDNAVVNISGVETASATEELPSAENGRTVMNTLDAENASPMTNTLNAENVIPATHTSEAETVSPMTNMPRTETGGNTSGILTLVGIGMGTPEQMTLEAHHALEQAQVIFGAKRMLDAVSEFPAEKVCEYRREQIASYLCEHPKITRAAVVFSGDVGFYSGADSFGACLNCGEKSWNVRRIAGISSVNYFAAKLGVAWQDVTLCSVHGRDTDLPAQISQNKKVFSLFNGGEQLAELAGQLSDCGLDHVRMSVGFDLGYETEEIWRGSVREFFNHPVRRGLCVALFEHGFSCRSFEDMEQSWDLRKVVMDGECKKAGRKSFTANPLRLTTGNIPDASFQRGAVPLSKEEIRAVALSKLRLTADAVCYDIGAGTGGMTMDIARFVPDGRVYAFEKKDAACTLLQQNVQKFHAQNVHIVQGSAPEILADAEAPTHAFIGGSGGRLREIAELLLKKNPSVRVVIDAITLETVGEANELIKSLPVKDVDIVSVTVAKAKSAGAYHLMESMNPVYIFSFTGAGRDEMLSEAL